MRLALTKHTEYALRILVWLTQTEADQAAHDAASVSGANRGGAANGTAGAARVAQAPIAVGTAGTVGHSMPPQRHKAAKIAASTGVPPVFATRILAQLQRQGLLLARAGQQGGYTLARQPADISLLEVIESVEGPLVTQTCVMRELVCGTQGYCVLHDAWSTAQSALRRVLADTSLASAVGAPPSLPAAVAGGRLAPDGRRPSKPN
jgi:Rrf2 family protein